MDVLFLDVEREKIHPTTHPQTLMSKKLLMLSFYREISEIPAGCLLFLIFKTTCVKTVPDILSLIFFGIEQKKWSTTISVGMKSWLFLCKTSILLPLHRLFWPPHLFSVRLFIFKVSTQIRVDKGQRQCPVR